MKGLTTVEVQERLQKHGYNELPSAKPKNVAHIALEVVQEPMFLLLIACGTLYMILGDYQEGAILLASIFIIIFITFYQYNRTEKALEALRNLASPRALVFRDGQEVRIAGREVVPDDVLLLHEGDRIPADAIVLDTIHLMVDESMLTGESVPVLKEFKTDHSDPACLLYSGTLVVRGKGSAVVSATGINTQFGKIGTSLISIESESTRLQKEMKVLIRNLFLIGAFISVGVVAAFYFTRGDFMGSLLNGLAASMAILPEEFPVVLTVFMALGAWRLSKKNVLTRKPSAIETLGSATVLCTDKTGTITQNKMNVVAMHKDENLWQRADIIQHKDELLPLITSAFLASHKNSIDPMERAIAESYQNLGGEPVDHYELIKEFPFERASMSMTRVMKNTQTEEHTITAKGAPEGILTLCNMEEGFFAEQLLAVQEMAGSGLRVIAVAQAVWKDGDLPELQEDFDFSFLGLIGLEDPIRPEVPQAIKDCQDAGIHVIMITGDYPLTAQSIAAQIGLETGTSILTGDELNHLSEDALKLRLQQTHVVARVVPKQKLRIVRALKANREIVAMTGDGVNDAPALKAAHIGIAMGGKGTDVAREASSLVLLDDNFASIVGAIRLGRRIFDNLQKAMSFIIAIHIPIIGLVLLSAFVPWLPILLLPLHIVFMELITDPICSVAFELEQEEKGIMKRAPRDAEQRFFTARNMIYSVLQGALVLAMVIGVLLLSEHEGHSDDEIRAITFSALTLGVVFLVLTKLSRSRNVFSVIAERNIAAVLVLSTSVISLIVIMLVPALRNIFHFAYPGWQHFFLPVIGAVSVLIVLELVKWLRRKSY